MTQPINTQTSAARHLTQQDTTMQSGSYSSTLYQSDSLQRQQGAYSGQPAFSYANTTTAPTRPTPAINLNVNMNTATYSQNIPQRHQSPQQSNVMPSIEGRAGYYTPAPPYEEGESKGDQPSTTGSHGFPSLNPTAGSRHDRR